MKKQPESISAFVYDVTRSSVDPNELSLTVKGILTAFIPVVLAFTRGSIDLSAGDLTMLIDQIIMVIQSGAALASALMVAYGSLRKVWASFKK